MSAPRIEWLKLSQDELASTLNEGQAEVARRLVELRSLLGVQPQSGPGRKAADPLERRIAELLGEDSNEMEDAVAADSGLS